MDEPPLGSASSSNDRVLTVSPAVSRASYLPGTASGPSSPLSAAPAPGTPTAPACLASHSKTLTPGSEGSAGSSGTPGSGSLGGLDEEPLTSSRAESRISSLTSPASSGSS